MNLWTLNAPDRFWQCQPDLPPEIWAAAVLRSMTVLRLSPQPRDIERLLAVTLGEGRLGPNTWRLTPLRWLYYRLKPFLPFKLRLAMKATYFKTTSVPSNFGWPIDNRYPHFLFEVLRQALVLAGVESVAFRSLWPDSRQFALTLTHDIETANGQAHVAEIADLEERLGFRSSFNFVPERYPVDRGLMLDLRARGFEVGVHGLKHDGKLFASRKEFERRALRINYYLREFEAVGFRAPLMHRNPYWLQDLDVEYDMSFFDTDPYEPMPGGVMTVWPFMLGRFVELPYTLAQDSTLQFILKEKTPRIWLEKLEFVRQMHGMALINTHPDYLVKENARARYVTFLQTLSELREEFWNALPRETARWWRLRADRDAIAPEICFSEARLDGDGISLEGVTPFFIETPEYIERCHDGGTYDGNN